MAVAPTMMMMTCQPKLRRKQRRRCWKRCQAATLGILQRPPCPRALRGLHGGRSAAGGGGGGCAEGKADLLLPEPSGM